MTNIDKFASDAAKIILKQYRDGNISEQQAIAKIDQITDMVKSASGNTPWLDHWIKIMKYLANMMINAKASGRDDDTQTRANAFASKMLEYTPTGYWDLTLDSLTSQFSTIPRNQFVSWKKIRSLGRESKNPKEFEEIAYYNTSQLQFGAPSNRQQSFLEGSPRM